MSTTVEMGSRATAIAEQAVRTLPGGNTRSTVFVPPRPPYAVSAAGAFLTDVDGHTVLDCNNNYTALVHGHAHEATVRAVLEAIPRGTAYGLPTELEVELSQVLASRVASADQFRFVNSGTEAVMMALRAARAFTGRDKIIRFEGSYHGVSDAVVDPSSLGVPAGVASDVIVLPAGDIGAVRTAIAKNRDLIAGGLLDLMPNRAGLVPADAEFVHQAAEAIRADGGLLVVDEVITFRVGFGGLQGVYDVEPDLTVLGKAIGGGFPVGAVGGSERVMAVFDPRTTPHVGWGGTFNANPITLTAGLAALSDFDLGAVERINDLGDALRANLVSAGHKVNGRGSLLRVFPSDPIAAWWSLYDAGYLLSTNGLIALSTAMTPRDVEGLGGALRSVLDESH